MLLKCGVCRLLDSSHSDWRVMVPHCGFDLHFSDMGIFFFYFLFLFFSDIGCLVTYCLDPTCLCFLQLYLVMDFSYCHWKQMLVTISTFKNSPGLGLWSMIWSVVENIPCLLEMKVYSASFRWNVLQISNLSGLFVI